MNLTEARRRIADLIRFFEERYGVSMAFESGVSGELLQAYTALRRAETAAEKLGEPA